MNLPLWARLGLGIGLAAGIAYTTTPVAILAARRLAFYDIPFGYKGHKTPTPYLGGAAVMTAFILALLLVVPDFPARTFPLLVGVMVMFVLGTIDDRRQVSPQLRVAVELALGALLAADGLGWRLGSGGALDAAVTGIWVVGVVNAFNLFDNMDGAAAMMAITACGGACALALVTGSGWVAAAAGAMFGACLGFLPHNLSSPAKIFLGDGGSMPIGFVVAMLVAVAAHSAEPGVLGLLVGFLLVGIPALDTTLVIVSRVRRGVSLLTAGRDHLTHRTRLRMRTPRRVALILGGTQALLSAMVIVASRAGSPALVYIVLAFVVLAVAAIVALEDAIGANTRAETATVSGLGGPGGRRIKDRVAAVTLAVLGLGAGLSPLLSAYYNPAIWVPVGLALVVLAATATIARPPRLTPQVSLTLVGLAGLGVWSLLSTGWSDAVEQAIQSANLWLTYAALFLLMIALLARRRRSFVLLAAAGLGVVVVAVTVLARLLGTAPGDMFIAGRLNSPLGYINGEGCVFAMGAWLSLALAERREAALAGLGAAATVAMALLALLTQSRGAAIATGVAVVVALAVIPGFRRRVLALAVVGAAMAAASGPVLHLYAVGQAGTVSSGAAHRAAVAILLAGAIAGLVWGALTALARFADRRGEPFRSGLVRIVTVVCVLVIAVPLIGVAVRASSIERTLRTQWHQFVHLSTSGAGGPALSGSQTRLFSGAGNRYDYWRVSWHVFLAHPVLGVGAGNYPESYFRDRRTTEAIQNPHSLELQTLSELGAPGVLLLALLFAGIGLAIVRLRGPARASPGARTVMVAATGTVVVWLVDTSGDWMHLLPGVTAVALAAVAALCRAAEPEASAAAVAAVSPAAVPVGSPATRPAGRRLPRLLGGAAAMFVLAVGGASLARTGLARHYLVGARGALATNPNSTISQANQALALDGANLDAYYVKAAAEARFNRAGLARSTLLQAAREDSGNFVTWALLGDLEVRAGHFQAAHAYYRQALLLDPREPELRVLVADPARSLAALGR